MTQGAPVIDRSLCDRRGKPTGRSLTDVHVPGVAVESLVFGLSEAGVHEVRVVEGEGQPGYGSEHPQGALGSVGDRVEVRLDRDR